jgi:hypothetical protein
LVQQLTRTPSFVIRQDIKSSAEEKQRREEKGKCKVQGAAPAMANNAEELGLRLYALCHDRENIPSATEMQSLIARGANVNTKDEYAWNDSTSLGCP